MKNSLLKWAAHLSKGTTCGYATRKDFLIVLGFCILLYFAHYCLYYFIGSILNVQGSILYKYVDFIDLIPLYVLIIIADFSLMFMRINDMLGKRCFTAKWHILSFIGLYFLIFEGFVGTGILEIVFDIQPIINSESWLGFFISLLFLIILCAYPSSSKEREEMPVVEYKLPKKTIAVFIAITIANFGFFLYKAVDEQGKFNYGEAIELKSDYAEAYINTENSYTNNLDCDIEIFEKIFELESDSAEVYHAIGIVFSEESNYDGAIKCYEKAIKLKPDNAQAYNNMGIAYAGKLDYDKAIECYKKAIELKPDYAWAYKSMGIAYEGKANYDKAIEYYKKAIDLKPDFSEAYDSMGITYARKSDYDKAIECFKKAIVLNPNNANAYNNMGIAYESKLDYDKAIECYKKVLELNPNDVDAYDNIERAEKSKKKNK